ncbi:MAG: hypothetical protein RIG63_16730 [Coleofasciculus chthonoplastes F3-SA18-01]
MLIFLNLDKNVKSGICGNVGFGEHLIRDEVDFAKHCDYIHYNPVKHGLCSIPQEWRFSSLHRLMVQGIYPPNWGVSEVLDMPGGIWDE